MDDIKVRVAVVEERQRFTDATVVRLEHQLEVLNGNLAEMNKLFSRYQGMGATAVVFIVGASSSIAFLLNFLFKR